MPMGFSLNTQEARFRKSCKLKQVHRSPSYLDPFTLFLKSCCCALFWLPWHETKPSGGLDPRVQQRMASIERMGHLA